MNLLPQFGFFELVLVAVVALIVVGPKDLPKLMRSAGRLVAKARSLAGEFTAAFDQMAREAEMEDLRKEIEELKKNNPVADAKRAMDEATAPIAKELREEARGIDKAVKDATKETPPNQPSNEAAKS
ncbi:Sec-independent protein translocase protein TatB [Hyphococcus sp.]|uniref:Sec-independent protein translocase protein TatB n=1 Tax=Hyphococcus sp. TaxID=2038636 RepID=UPI003D11C72F